MPPRRKEKENKRLRHGYLGQDFGSSTSKLSFCQVIRSRASTDGTQFWTPHVSRVPLRADLDDPERNNSAVASSFEFTAQAAFRAPGEPLQTGRAALQSDNSVPLKTIFMFAAGIQRGKVLRRLPGGKVLSQALLNGHVTPATMARAVEDHLRLLRRAAEEEAEEEGILIIKHILSMPNYLCEWEDETDTEIRYYDVGKYQRYYEARMIVAWKGSKSPLDIQWIMEGQAAAIYICEPFKDVNSMISKRKIWDKLGELAYEDEATGEDTGDSSLSWLNTIIVDNGSSSLGIQVQTAFLNDDGTVESSQASFHQDWKPGVTGGSHLTNERVAEIIRDQLEYQPIQSGYVAELLADYDAQKHKLDWSEISTPLTFHTSDDMAEVVIPPQSIQNIFAETFTPGLRLIEDEVERVMKLGENFAIIFCGGSYVNKGLRRKAKECLARWERKADQRGIKFKYLFLGEFDNAATSAVACGAALSAARIPAVDEVLRGSAIGVQVTKRVPASRTRSGMVQWDEERHGDFLLSKGCGEPPYIDYKLPSSDTARVRLRLVCDPNFYDRNAPGPEQLGRDETPRAQRPRRTNATYFPVAMERSRITKLMPGTGTTIKYKTLPIGVPYKHVNGPLETYDLGFEADSRDLPNGKVRFKTRGRSARRLARGESDDNQKHEMPIEVRCTKLDETGVEVDDPLNKRWIVTLYIHPASKLLATRSLEIPDRCSGPCGEEITRGRVSVCDVCPRTAYCDDCFDELREAHEEDHKFEVADLDL